jgi:C1A family cysteine protease
VTKAWDYTKTIGQEDGLAYPFSSGQSGTKGACDYDDRLARVCTTQYTKVASNISAMRTALESHAFTASVDASSSLWKSYSGGTITSDDCGTTLNHSVAVVGYKVQTVGYDYWIVRNSFGKGWGDDGYA